MGQHARGRTRHDVTDELAAYKLAQIPFPGVFGVFYQNDRPTKNAPRKMDREHAKNSVTRATSTFCKRPSIE
jgi:hypothetical protein